MALANASSAYPGRISDADPADVKEANAAVEDNDEEMVDLNFESPAVQASKETPEVVCTTAGGEETEEKHSRPSTPLNEPADPAANLLVPPTSERPFIVNLLLLILLMCLGMVEGASFQRTGIYLPEAIAGQMTFKVWVVLKMFISAVGASMLVQGILSLAVNNDFTRSRNYRVRKVGFVRVILGSSLLGAGMAIAGSGPTMLSSQVGAGVKNAWAILVGSFLGGLAFAVFEKVAPDAVAPPEPDDMTVENRLPGKLRYEFLSIPGGVVVLGICLGLEFAVKHSDDEAKLDSGELPWWPIIGGCIVGLNQIPLRLIGGHGQGGSTSIMNVIGTVTCGFLAPNQQVKGFQQMWQFALVWVGSPLGALAASQINDSPMPQGFAIWRSIVGGFLMLIGGRIAGGCTCGHGISGVSELSLESFVAAVFIFGVGIATGFIIEAAGGTNCCGTQ